MSKKIDASAYIGTRFSELTVVSDAGSINGRTHVRCVCDCGNEVVVLLSCLRRGEKKSCGCRQKRLLIKRNTSHGHANERLYIVWGGMKRRCNCKSGPDNKNYASRGIKLCPEWLDYNNFREWAYANGYNENAAFGECTIDRIDVNKGYEPNNCRWVPDDIQAINRRNNFLIEYNGETHCLMEWARITGIKRETIKRRYDSGRRGAELFDKRNLQTGNLLSKRNE